MKLTFLGTKGFIKIQSPYHKKHTTTLISYNNKVIMLDCGLDWLGSLDQIKPDAIVITHESWKGIRSSAGIKQRIVVILRAAFDVYGLSFEAFRVNHSVRAPAVGYRITAGITALFYVPDVQSIPEQHAALSGIKLYIGDGAIVTRGLLVRQKDHELTGHSPIRDQLEWCHQEGVKQAIFTHCGTEIVKADPIEIEKIITSLGNNYALEAAIAYDGMTLTIR
jgi:ribonuclease BN (tRNA processing enzyme)